MSALNEQVGGSHYKDMAIQPIVFCKLNNLGPHEELIIKYLCRHHKKGGIEDLQKAKDCINKLIEHEVNALEIRTSDVCQSCFNKHLVAKTFGYEFLNCECKCHFCDKMICCSYCRDGIIEHQYCGCHKEKKDE